MDSVISILFTLIIIIIIVPFRSFVRTYQVCLDIFYEKKTIKNASSFFKDKKEKNLHKNKIALDEIYFPTINY